MTHTTRIPVSQALEDAFATARTQGGVRFVVVSIQNESLECDCTHPFGSSMREDFVAVQNYLDDRTPRYVLFCLDSENIHGNQWLLISYVPENSPVKSRMLYASTRDPLKKQLGTTYFVKDLFASEKEEITEDTFLDQRNTVTQDMYSASELHKKHEATAIVDPGHTREYVHSVKFPLSQQAQQALGSFGKGNNFVQLMVDAERETIELSANQNINANQLADVIPHDEPRFSFFFWSHQHAGQTLKSNIFIYSCPDISKIKLRMLYSTVKSVVSDAAEKAGVDVERSGKIEICDVADLNEAFLQHHLHPPAIKKSTFARPMAPGRGPQRLTGGRAARRKNRKK